MANKFSWIPFYKELADKLVDWEDRQNELISFIEELRSNDYKVTPLMDKNDQGDSFLLTEIDPFTVFGVFNRGISQKERIAILTEFKKKFNIQSPLPTDFDGIPVINNQQSWFFAYQVSRKIDDIQKLWHVFKLALEDKGNKNDLMAAIDDAFHVWGVNVNLTMGLYWIRPERFISLDKNNRTYLGIQFPTSGLNSSFYLSVLDSISKRKESFPEISLMAYQNAKQDSTKKEQLPSPDEHNYWLVGAYWDGDDQTQRFIDEGIWQNGYEDKYIEDVKSMKPGDKIAIKASATQKLHLPFDSRGHTVSKNIIKARGTITDNRGDGRNIAVEWDSDFEPKEWFFYTFRITVSKLNLSEDYDLIEHSRNLVDFIWNHKPQDYEWYLDRWYGDEADKTKEEVQTEEPYSVDDILKSDIFLEQYEIENMLEKLKTKKNIILQGSPGVGKTFLARKLAYALIEEKNEKRVEMVQFHQSYCYEDFVRGFRPNPDEGNNFYLRDAVFYNFCKKAEEDPENQYVFIIDEINRGNISQIFGELLMLIEVDKRNKKYAIPLMYSRTEEERFHIPPNVFIIGLMNTADRSIAIVDYALRRRFSFFTLRPKFNSEKYKYWLQSKNMKEELIDFIITRMNWLNEEIANDSLLGVNFQIGHSYFCPNKSDFAQLETDWYLDIIETEIIPLLQEYWFDDPNRVEKIKNRLITT